MKWKISVTASGAYKITPLTGEANDYVLSIEGTFLNIPFDGAKLIQNIYGEDSDYKDEWFIRPFTTIFCAITNTAHNHSSAFETLNTCFREKNLTNNLLDDGAMQPSHCLSDLLNANIFISRSHGNAIVYTGTDVVATTFIALDDYDPPVNALFSHGFSGMEPGWGYINFNSDDLEHQELAAFIACHTGSGGNGANNLPTRVVASGTKCAIGFQDEIICSSANVWTKNFVQKLAQGYTVLEASNYACEHAPAESGLKSITICGDSSIRIVNNESVD